VIPFFDPRPTYRELRAEIDAAIARVLASGRLILGPEVEAFEREFAAHLGLAGAVGVNSGTDAIKLALRALGVGAGDEVLTVANAGVPAVAALREAGADPRFVDVRPDTLLIDPGLLEAARTPRVRAVLVTHLYGRPVPMEPVLEFARAHRLRVVEDCAQSHGTTWRGRPAGVFGDVGCFSFYPTKNLGAFGDAGLCATDDPDLGSRIRALRMYGFEGAERHARVEGVNSRLDELQAAVLRAKLPHLGRAVDERRRLAALYLSALGDGPWRLPCEVEGHGWHLFVIRHRARDRAVAALRDAGIGFGLHYPEPVHRMDAYRGLGYAAGSLPESERAADEVLSLPLYPGLGDEQAGEVARVLRAAA